MDPVDRDERNRAAQEGAESAFDCAVDAAFDDDDVILEVVGEDALIEMMNVKQTEACRWFAHFCCSFKEIPDFSDMIREAESFTSGGAFKNFDDMLHSDDAIRLAYAVCTDHHERNRIKGYACGEAFIGMANRFIDQAVSQAREDWGDLDQDALREYVSRGKQS